ncbi:MAG TPA: hypothetical protein VMU94_28425 [Streptosporangiaceae bacterium]|nr:hypothetical protein [Streptosporangiaceae bacterium]
MIGRDVLAGPLPWLLAAAGIAAAGAWLRWCVIPVALAFRLGCAAERVAQRRRVAELEAAVAALEELVIG